MAADLSYLAELQDEQATLVYEIETLKGTLPDFENRYNDWTREAARTQNAKDIATRDAAYAELKQRRLDIQSRETRLETVNKLIEAELKRVEGEATTPEERAAIAQAQADLEKAKLLTAAASQEAEAKKTRNIIIWTIVIVVVIVVGVILLKRFRVF